ncbi:MAG TPA: hypothetical protein VL240_07030 [Candidatus Binatia bacterium]|nr:hypothetical protein [Candidatus Binatia bacterium]
MVDLNALIENPGNLTVFWAMFITDSGEISGSAIDPYGNTHRVVLVPHRDCDSSCEQRITESQNTTPPVRYQANTAPAQSRSGRPADRLRNPPLRRNAVTKASDLQDSMLTMAQPKGCALSRT